MLCNAALHNCARYWHRCAKILVQLCNAALHILHTILLQSTKKNIPPPLQVAGFF